MLQKAQSAIISQPDVASNPIQHSVKKSNKYLSTLTSLPIIALIFILIKTIIELLVSKIFHVKEYELQFFQLSYAVLFFMIMYYFSSLYNNSILINKNLNTISLFVVIYLGLQINTYRRLDALKIQAGIPIKTIKFLYNNHKISTSRNILYIGQTQSSLFLYDLKDSSTTVYKISGLDSLVVK